MSKWLGDGSGKAPECDLGKHMGVPGKHDMTKGFVDGKTTLGPWGLMCLECHEVYGYGLGTGRGQRYDGVTHEKLEG